MIPHYVNKEQECSYCENEIYIEEQCFMVENELYCSRECIASDYLQVLGIHEIYLTNKKIYKE